MSGGYQRDGVRNEGTFRGSALDPRIAEVMTRLHCAPSVAEDGAVLYLGEPMSEYSYRVTAKPGGLDLLFVGERREMHDVGTFASLEAVQIWWLEAHSTELRGTLGIEPQRVTVDRWGTGSEAPGTEVTHGEGTETLTVAGKPFATLIVSCGSGSFCPAVALSTLALASPGEVLAALESRDGGPLFSPGPYTWMMSDRRLPPVDRSLQVPDPHFTGRPMTDADLAATVASGFASREQALTFMAGFRSARVCREYTNKPNLWDEIDGEAHLIVWLGEPRDRGWNWHTGTGADAIAQTRGEGGLVVRHGTDSLVLTRDFVSAYL